MNDPERAMLLSVHPRFANAILAGSKTVEVRRQRVAAPPGTPVLIGDRPGSPGGSTTPT